MHTQLGDEIEPILSKTRKIHNTQFYLLKALQN